MGKTFLLFLVISATSYGAPPSFILQPALPSNHGSFGYIDELTSLFKPQIKPLKSLTEIKNMMKQLAPSLSPEVVNKVMATLQCADDHHIDHNQILTVIDYSLPSNHKRLWVFDLSESKLLFYTYVSHGIKSGTLFTNYFSNKYNSKATSLGIYRANKAYYGREGLSLRLGGLDRSFNDNADGRSIVMHGGWYVDEKFIKAYGRPGRSWGCPALPPTLSGLIINTIKDNSIIIAYYPSDDWFVKSKFLNCAEFESRHSIVTQNTIPIPSSSIDELRGDILYLDLHRNNNHEESDPVVVISAENYKRIFHTSVPLGRMLRRQINHAEFIALTREEYDHLSANSNQSALNQVYFVVPEVKMKRGYYETEMKIVDYGKLLAVKTNDTAEKAKPMINLKSTNQFIRWLGL
jgi:hypothetical protein